MLLPRTLEDSLNGEAGPACGLDEEGTFTFFNRAWNGWVDPPDAERATSRWLHGRRWLDSISGEHRAFFERLLRLASELPVERGAWLMHVSECNTPTLIRKCVTMLAPVRDAGAVTGVVIVYSLEHLGTPSELYGVAAAPVAEFRSDRGELLQCGDCRRVRHSKTGAWAFVTEAVARVDAATRFGVCETCRTRYLVEPVIVS